MTLVTKLRKALEVFAEEPLTEATQRVPLVESNARGFYRSLIQQMNSEENPTRKIRELESLVYQLSAKVTVLVDKIHELDDRITQLTTSHEELLNIIDNFGQQEDIESVINPYSKEKKFGLN